MQCVVKVVGGDQPYMHPDQIEEEHLRCLQSAERLFHQTKKMGGPEFSKQYSEQLHKELEVAYENFRKHNEAKNVFSAARTPAVLFTIVVTAYVVAGILAVFGFETVASLLNMVMVVFLLLMLTWLYVRYTGQHRNVSLIIDHVADAVWDNVSSSLQAFCFVVFVPIGE